MSCSVAIDVRSKDTEKARPSPKRHAELESYFAVSTLFAAADDGIIATRGDLIHDSIERTEYRKADKCCGYMEQHIVKGKQL